MNDFLSKIDPTMAKHVAAMTPEGWATLSMAAVSAFIVIKIVMWLDR